MKIEQKNRQNYRKYQETPTFQSLKLRIEIEIYLTLNSFVDLM